MLIFLAITSFVAAVTSAGLFSYKISRKYEEEGFEEESSKQQLIRYAVICSILACYAIVVTIVFFDLYFFTWIFVVSFLTYLNIIYCNIDCERLLGIFGLLEEAIIIIGITYFSFAGREVISSYTETKEKPLVLVEGRYVERRESSQNDCVFYEYYLKDENGKIEPKSVSSYVCELKTIVEGEPRLETIATYETVKYKYSGKVKEEVQADWTLYVPEG